MRSRSGTPAALGARQFDLVAKAIADPRRMAILEAIGTQHEYPCQRLCRESPVTKGTVSHHIKELRRAGLIRSRRAGRYTHLEICREILSAYSAELMRRAGCSR